MSTILVTGGRGFIGTNRTEELRSRGHEVRTSDIEGGQDPQHYKADVAAFHQIDEIFQRHSFDFTTAILWAS